MPTCVTHGSLELCRKERKPCFFLWFLLCNEGNDDGLFAQELGDGRSRGRWSCCAAIVRYWRGAYLLVTTKHEDAKIPATPSALYSSSLFLFLLTLFFFSTFWLRLGRDGTRWGWLGGALFSGVWLVLGVWDYCKRWVFGLGCMGLLQAMGFRKSRINSDFWEIWDLPDLGFQMAAELDLGFGM